MKKNFSKGLEGLEERIRENLRSDVPLIHLISDHLLSGGGKRIRPLLVILCSRLCGYDRPDLLDLASAIEYIHTASLLHDDVVDCSTLRRGRPSANAVWGNNASVLVGDFLFARSFSVMVRFGKPRIMEILSAASEIMAKGEVLQLANIRDPSPDIGPYLDVVRCKTAALMAAACRCGAALGESDPTQESALEQYGLKMGMAFQFMDDVLDYVGDENEFGKARGSDLAEGKLTLPLLLALQRAEKTERDLVMRLVSQTERSAVDFQNVFSLIERYDGIGLARGEVRKQAQSALEELRLFPDGAEKEMLCQLSEYLMERRR